jgi:hypothetical protein
MMITTAANSRQALMSASVNSGKTFSDVVEVIKILSTDEKRKIHLLLQQYLREENHDEIYSNFELAQVEQQKGELKFSSGIEDLKQLVKE